MPPYRYAPPLFSPRTAVGVVAALFFVVLPVAVITLSKKALSMTHNTNVADTPVKLSTSHWGIQGQGGGKDFRDAGGGGYVTLSDKAKFPNQDRSKGE